MQKVFSRVLIKDKNHNILVIQHSNNRWYFPGGKMEIGETPLACAIREVKEEIDVDVHHLTEIFQGDFTFEKVKWRGYFYFADSVSGIPTINEVEKIKDLRFINNLNSVDLGVELSNLLNQLSTSYVIQTKPTSWK
ncbi:MAG: NUDIX hydrolase [Turicibacter sp.]